MRSPTLCTLYHCFLFVCIFGLLSGCMFLRQEKGAVVVEPNGKRTRAPVHVVQSGETLYKIAWEWGYDYRELAYKNKIASPFVIYPGQKLRLPTPGEVQKKASVFTAVLRQEPSVSFFAPFQNEIEWGWPAQGKMVATFMLKGKNINKGIDIAGRLGEKIQAAAAGRVVYSGVGLRGYGQLLILKHSDVFLSAYAHNSQLLVEEGMQVKKGEVIAFMGHSGTDTVKLHFEIRKNGQPINPTELLPRKTSI